jgi:hypothetical protein
MGTKINDIVIVNITREGAKITRAGFGTLLILGTASFAERVRTYTNPDDAEVDHGLGLISDLVYAGIQKAFSQEIKPERVKVGKRDADASQENLVTVDVVQNAANYIVTINGTNFTFTSDADATEDEITAGLEALINAGAEPVTALDNADGTLSLEADSDGTPFTLAVSANMSSSVVTEANGILSSLSAVEQADQDWYALAIEHDPSETEFLKDVLLCAGWIEARRKIFGFSTSQASAITDVDTDIFSVLQGLAYDRTFGFYVEDESEFFECALFGRNLPEDAGSINWKFTQLAGVTVVNLSGTELGYLSSKNANQYELVAGVNIVSSEAVVASGEYIDIIIGVDSLQADIEESVFSLLVEAKKVPFTNDGYTMLTAPLRAALERKVPDFITGYTVIQPDVSTIPSADKAVRFASGIKFEAPLTGAVNKTKIIGTLSI